MVTDLKIGYNFLTVKQTGQEELLPPYGLLFPPCLPSFS